MEDTQTCPWCDKEFAVEGIDTTDDIQFCPYCGLELLDEGESSISIGGGEDDDGN